MPFALGRRNLSCFYCGRRSAVKWSGGAQEWRCNACEAVNYLDKAGQIADPPPQPSPHPANPVRYARPVSPTYPEEADPPEDIFCSTCLKNQHILKETLSAYLPPEDAADYDEFLVAYDSYRQQLEQRYPQVCERCAPRAREQIRKASYVAKTDHLRRMIDRTKTGDALVRGDTLSKNWFLGLVGFASRTSALLQACWHGLMILSLTTKIVADRDLTLGQGESKPQSQVLASVLDQLLWNSRIETLTLSIPLALVVSLLTIWWNPLLRAKQLHPSGRLEGLTQFYILQLASLLARAAALYKLNPAPESFRVDLLRGLHGFMLVFIISVLVISSKSIHLNTRPLFTFPAQDQPILPHIPASNNIEPAAQRQTQSVQTDRTTPFPIHNLAPTPLSRQRPNNPPTPPPDDEDDPDSMDWTPTGKPSALSLNPQPRVPPAPSAFQGPSPFHGTLPPAPLAPSHKLRNPAAYNPATFRKASAAQQTAFAATTATPLRRSTRKTANTNTTANPYDSDTTDVTADDDDASIPGSAALFRSHMGKKSDLDMAQPRFFLEQDQRNTGLEDMFGTAFGLQDTPQGVRPKAAPALEQLAQNPGWFGWGRRRGKEK